MVETVNRYRIYKVDYTTFGGEISTEDFNTYSPNKKRISNYVNAICESEQRKEEQKYKHMTLEELKNMKIISNTNGRPSATLTDQKWQKEFHIRKLFIKPYNKDVKKLKSKNSIESVIRNDESKSTYCGKTNWQEYCAFINSVLQNIRSGQKDYCYFIYQIEDLLKFHFDTLKTRYRDGYWEVWLEK